MKNQTYITCYKKKATDTDGYLFLQSKGRKNRKKKALGIRIVYEKFIKNWNEKEQRFKSGMPLYKLLNEKIEKAFEDYIKETGEIIETKTITKQSFLKFWNDQINLIPKIGSKVKHTTVKNKLEKYLKSIGKNDLLFSDMTPEFIDKLHSYLQKAPDLQTASVNSYMKLINNICRRKVKKEPYIFDINPFVSITYDTKTATKRKVLNATEINSLLTTKIDDPELDFVRDMYVFQIFSSGMRVSDLCLLRWNAIKTTQIVDVLLEGGWFDIVTGKDIEKVTVELFESKVKSDIRLDYIMYKTREGIKTPFTYYICKAILKAIGEGTFFDKFLQSEFIVEYEGSHRKLWELEFDVDKIKDKARKKELTDFIAVCEYRKIGALIYHTAYKVSNFLKKGNVINNFVFPILKSEDFKNISNDDTAFKDVISKTEDLHHKLLYGEKIYRRQLDKVGDLCNISDMMPHSARHTFTQLMINAGAPTHKIQFELRHTSLGVTDSYTRHKEFSNLSGEDFLGKVGNKIEFLDN